MLKIKYFIISILMLSSIAAFGQSGFEDALSKAKSENKRVIIDVYTDWCGWCKKMDAEAYSNAEVKKIIEENFVVVKLDAEGSGKLKYNGKEYTEEQLSYYFDVFSFPTTIFLEPDGKVIYFKYDNTTMKSVPGYFPTEDFKKILNYIKDGKYKDTDLSKIV